MTSNQGQQSGNEPRPSLTRFAWLSIAAAIVTIVLKASAYALTGSVGLLSDALESLVNLVAAIVALIALTVAAREPDEERAYGYTKAEYFSSGIEGGLIFLAAVTILYTAVDRLLHPAPVEALGLGIVISFLASLVNLAVALRLRRAGREYHSITLEADARHLMTDVWTTAGVLAGVGAVALTGWLRLDPLIAMAVGVNIIWAGVQLVPAIGGRAARHRHPSGRASEARFGARVPPGSRHPVPCDPNPAGGGPSLRVAPCAGPRPLDDSGGTRSARADRPRDSHRPPSDQCLHAHRTARRSQILGGRRPRPDAARRRSRRPPLSRRRASPARARRRDVLMLA